MKTLLRIVTGQYEYIEITVDKILTPNEVKEYTRLYRGVGDDGIREGEIRKPLPVRTNNKQKNNYLVETDIQADYETN